ncbi:MAG: MYXO-CTERM sorting domain-containing protein [Myxococcales bacterium]|nr:MYXO-CTERM sorting domain-containing protein [Myxococcales bacterium]MBK7193953.1 MYXO-CTERM sorting domain-containing protein [Myxococcales bacterium]
MRIAPSRLVLATLALGALALPAAAQQSTFRSTHQCGTPQIPREGGPGPVAAAAATRTIYLNKNGGTYNITGSVTNSSTNTAATTVSANRQARTATIAPINAQFNWTFIAQCVRDAYARYDVRVVETEPTSGNYVEAVVGGTGTELGFGANQLFGIASADNFCGVTERGIAFSFSGTHLGVPQQDRELCATIAHEVGHILALEHVATPADEMSYVGVSEAGAWPKSFIDMSSQCGTTPQSTMANCTCGGNRSNTHQRLVQYLGLRATETIPPTVAITSPTAGTIARTFTITADATDASGIAEVAFKIDGVAIGTDSEPAGATYSVEAVRLAEGSHTITAEALDLANNRGTATVTVDVSFDCGGCGDGQTCVEGECLVATGETCSETVPCAGGTCLQNQAGDQFCSQPCSLDNDDCPSGFACADVGTGDGTGVCNFSDDGGCCSTGDQDGQGPFVGIGLGAIGLGLVVSRRRRRK